MILFRRPTEDARHYEERIIPVSEFSTQLSSSRSVGVCFCRWHSYCFLERKVSSIDQNSSTLTDERQECLKSIRAGWEEDGTHARAQLQLQLEQQEQQQQYPRKDTMLFFVSSSACGLCRCSPFLLR